MAAADVSKAANGDGEGQRLLADRGDAICSQPVEDPAGLFELALEDDPVSIPPEDPDSVAEAGEQVEALDREGPGDRVSRTTISSASATRGSASTAPRA